MTNTKQRAVGRKAVRVAVVSKQNLKKIWDKDKKRANNNKKRKQTKTPHNLLGDYCSWFLFQGFTTTHF